MKKNLIFLFFFLLSFNSITRSEIVNKISIFGNERIERSTILEYGGINLGHNYSINDLNNIQKKIYNTNFFEKISIELKNNDLIIKVVENKLINFFNIQGELSDDKSEKLYKMIKLGTNKIYSESLLKNDLETIKDYYFRRGFADIEVVPKISLLDKNKVNILIKINKNEQTKVNRIYFIGNNKFKNNELLDIISSSEFGWWKFLSQSTIATNDRVEYDKELLTRHYLNNGYYDIQISSTELKKISKYRSDIIFSINEGDLYRFGNFEISEGKKLINQEANIKIIELKNKFLKKNYSLKNKNYFLTELNNFFANEKIDFIEATLDEKKNSNKLDLYLKILPTKKSYVNEIGVYGNHITEESVIRRNLALSEGDSFTFYKKNKSLDNLKSLSIFKKSEINVVQTNDESKINLEIQVEEQPTGSISAGAGYGGNGASLGFGVKEINFLGKGISVDSNLNIGTQVVDGYVNLIIPDFDSSNKTLFSKIYSTKTFFSNTVYQSHKTGFDLSSRYQIYNEIFFKPGIGFNYDNVEVERTASNYLRSQSGDYITTKLSYNLDKDTRDAKFNTRQGYILGINQELATFVSDIPYIKNSFYGSNFFPITETETLNFKYSYSNISSMNSKDIKISDRLFISNQFTKGFTPRGYGPKDISSNEYIGGNNSFYTLISSSFPNPVRQSWNINSYAYIDTFNVWGVDNSNSIDSNKIRSSVGLNFDWRSPIGPINFSFSKPISKEDTDKTKAFAFEIGTMF